MKYLIPFLIIGLVGCGKDGGPKPNYYDACPPGMSFQYDAKSNDWFAFGDGKGNISYRPGICVNQLGPDLK